MSATNMEKTSRNGWSPEGGGVVEGADEEGISAAEEEGVSYMVSEAFGALALPSCDNCSPEVEIFLYLANAAALQFIQSTMCSHASRLVQFRFPMQLARWEMNSLRRSSSSMCIRHIGNAGGLLAA